MRPRFFLFLLLCPLLGLNLHPLQAQGHPVATAEAVQEAFVRVAERVKPSVATIVCEVMPKPPSIAAKPDDKTVMPPDEDEEDEDNAPFNFSDPNEPRTSLGTGVIIRADGYVLTNYHVVKNADVVRVLLDSDGERPDRPVAKLIGFDEESDLAVLKINRKDLPTASFADSDTVRIGQWALAIGAPFDQPQTFTAGVISAKGRHLDKKGVQGLQDYLQTDASINPGNSGGPLVNLDGQVIGINTAILSPSRFNVGIGFSVPSNTVKRLMPILLSGKSVQRGFLGIHYVRLDPKVAKEFGVTGGMQIGALAKKEDGTYMGPAHAAGLREDDILTAVNGTLITSSEQFRALVASSAPGTKLTFAVTRPGTDKSTQMETSVILGDMAARLGTVAMAKPAETKTAPVGFGLDVENADKLTASDKTRYGLEGKEKGAVITRIVPGSPADEADLRRGLRIVRARVGGVWQSVGDAGTWQKIEKNAASNAPILLQLRDRDNVSVYKVIVTPEKLVTPTI